MKRSLPGDSLEGMFTALKSAHEVFASRYPGPRGDRQPVHTFYGGAHLFRADTARRLGDKALEALHEYAPDFVAFASAIQLPGSEHLGGSADAAILAKSVQANPEAARRDNPHAWFASMIYQRVREKLRREPVEDFRIDFEDGFGNRPDEEEDRYAAAAAAKRSSSSSGRLPKPSSKSILKSSTGSRHSFSRTRW